MVNPVMIFINEIHYKYDDSILKNKKKKEKKRKKEREDRAPYHRALETQTPNNYS